MAGPSPQAKVRVVGPGRAGGALALALAAVGWHVASPIRRGEPVVDACAGVDLVVIATPDAVIAEVAAAIRPDPDVAVAHLAGSVGLEALAGHERRCAVHPLVALPSAEVGAARLRGAVFAVAGDPMAAQVARALSGRVVVVDDTDRAAYHAAACIASNHLVVLLAQAQRVAVSAGVPFAAYLDLVRATVDNVDELGPAAALTGPAARGDDATLERHRRALADDERELYDVLARGAWRLAHESDAGGGGR